MLAQAAQVLTELLNQRAPPLIAELHRKWIIIQPLQLLIEAEIVEIPARNNFHPDESNLPEQYPLSLTNRVSEADYYHLRGEIGVVLSSIHAMEIADEKNLFRLRTSKFILNTCAMMLLIVATTIFSFFRDQLITGICFYVIAVIVWISVVVLHLLERSAENRHRKREKWEAMRNVLLTINSQWSQNLGVEVSLIDDEDEGLVYSFRRINPLLVENVNDVQN